MKSAVRKFSKILLYSVIAIVLVVLTLAGFTQTRVFRDGLRDFITSTVSSRIQGTFSMGKLGGNFLTGFTIDSIAIVNDGDTLIAAQKVLLTYEPLSIINKTFHVRDLTLEHPSIFLKRPPGGQWNISALVTPSTGGESGTPDWTLNIHRFEIRRGEFRLLDSLALTASDHTSLPDPSVEYHNIHLFDVNLVLGATVRNGNTSATISKASFYSVHPEFSLTNFKAELSAESSRTRVNNFVLQTRQSYLELDAEIKGLNIFHGVDLKALQHDSTSLHLHAGNISFAELKQFLSPLEFLEGSASVDCDAAGEFGDLAVRQLNVNTLNSSLRLNGRVRNLHTPEKLYLNALLQNSRLDPTDPNKLMPSFSIPPFERAGVADARIEFEGTPTNFSGNVDLRGAFGSIKCSGALNISRQVPTYHARFATHKVTLENLFATEGFHSVLSVTGYIAGEGFTIATLKDSLNLAIDSTEVQRLKIDKGTLTLHARSRQLDIVSSIEGREMSASINGTGDFTDQLKPVYHGELMMSHFDLSKILVNDAYRSDITLRTKVDGEGKTIDDLSGKVTLSLLPSLYQGRNVSPQELSFALDQRSLLHKRLSLQASFADAELSGRFDLDLLVAALANQATHLISAVEEHASPPDSTGKRPLPREIAIPAHTETQRALDFTYKITVNDLEPIAAVTGGSSYNARGTIEGAMSGTDRLLSLSAKGNLDEFFIGTVANGIFLTGSRISLSARDLSTARPLEQLAMQCSLSVSSALINNRRCDNFNLDLDYKNLTGNYSTGGAVDSFYSLRSVGQASIQPHTYAIDMDSLEVNMRGYRWENDQDVQIRLNYDGIRILHAEMKRNDERCSLVGIIQHTGELSITGTLRAFNLEGIGTLFRDKDLMKSQRGFFGTCDADLRVSGSTASPVIHFSSLARQAHYRQTLVGTVSAALDYSDRLSTMNISVKTHPNDTIPTLLIKGTLPINLSLEGVDERFPDAEQHLEITSDGFDVSILDPLLADFDNLSGKLKCNVSLLGTARVPRYDGSITIADGRFTFGPNNIPYIVNGEFVPSGNKLLIKRLTATNPTTEPRQGDAHFTGSVTIRNFEVESFDVTAFGQLLLMTDATKKAIKTFYGTLFTETDTDGLNLRGTLQEPYLSGKLFVISADLVFPPTRSGTSVNPNQILNYILVEDTVREAAGGDAFASKFYRGYDAQLPSRSFTTPRKTEPSFVDRLRYHLDVETRGTTAVRMIFTPTTGEELYAEIEGKVTAINSNGSATIYNEISVTSRSYYNFFKRFEANGKLTFVGPWDNPELHIEATYVGYRQMNAAATAESQGLSSEQKSEQKVTVELHITGTRYEPKLEMGMKVQVDRDRPAVDWATLAKGGDIQGDAISFILTGKFREDLTSSERENIATNFGSAGATGFTSSLLSGIFTDFLRKEFPFIRNAEISYAGGNIGESANVRVSGEAFKGYFRVGGRILNDLGNANVSYQTSVGDFFNLENVRNLFIELERRVEGDYNEDRRLTNNARLYYRFSF